jgi:hypothetical protein
MSRNDVLTRVRQRPFLPFRLVLSEGTGYEVRHPDFIMVGRDSLTLGLTSEPDQGFYESTVLIALPHIVRLEPLAVSTTTGNGAASA